MPLPMPFPHEKWLNDSNAGANDTCTAAAHLQLYMSITVGTWHATLNILCPGTQGLPCTYLQVQGTTSNKLWEQTEFACTPRRH